MEIETMTVDTQRLVKALRLHKAWSDSERTGPDYGGQTRDTHPDGEKIWGIWRNNQLSLCDRAVSATDEALAYFDAMTADLDHAGIIRRNPRENETMNQKRCPWNSVYGELVCRDGYIWALTYSETAPPDQRQNIGPCSFCNKQLKAAQQDDLAS